MYLKYDVPFKVLDKARSDKGDRFKDESASTSLCEKKKSLFLGPLTVQTAPPAVYTLFIIRSSFVGRTLNIQWGRMDILSRLNLLHLSFLRSL